MAFLIFEIFVSSDLVIYIGCCRIVVQEICKIQIRTYGLGIYLIKSGKYSLFDELVGAAYVTQSLCVFAVA